MTYNYFIYGLTLSIPFPCPMLLPAPVGVEPDVSVTEGTVMRRMPLPAAEGPNWQAVPGRFLFGGGRFSGRFLVEAGERITLERNPDADDSRLCAHVLAPVIAALMRQRGMLVLHANVANTPMGAVAISGKTGSGKSTTHASLLARGCSMLTDDIAVLRLGQNSQVEVLPGIPKINLCEDTAIQLGHDITHLPRNPLRRIKVVVPVAPGNMVTAPVPLKAIYLLSSHSGKNLINTPLTGADKFAALQQCIYGPLFPEEHSDMFSISTALTRQIDVFRLERPDTGWSVDEIVEAILFHG